MSDEIGKILHQSAIANIGLSIANPLGVSMVSFKLILYRRIKQ